MIAVVAASEAIAATAVWPWQPARPSAIAPPESAIPARNAP